MLINVADIDADASWNSRTIIRDIKELADSIRESGLIQPLVVRKVEERYQLIAGFRRFAAVRSLKWKQVDVKVATCSEADAKLINLRENLDRANLNVLEEANALHANFPENVFSCRSASQRLGKDTSWILARRQLLKLPHDIQMMFASGKLPISRVKSVLDAPDPNAAAASLSKRKHVRAPMLGVRKRNNTQIRKRIIQLHEAGIQGLASACLAWCTGSVSDEDLDARIEELIQKGKSSEALE